MVLCDITIQENLLFNKIRLTVDISRTHIIHVYVVGVGAILLTIAIDPDDFYT